MATVASPAPNHGPINDTVPGIRSGLSNSNRASLPSLPSRRPVHIHDTADPEKRKLASYSNKILGSCPARGKSTAYQADDSFDI